MTYIIAEAGLNHNGSIDIAKELIRVAAESKCDAVKFQKRTIELLATEEILNAKDDRFPDFGKTYREIREHHEFSLEEYKSLKELSQHYGLDFIVTPFDTEAVKFLDKVGVDKFKLASHSLTNIPLLEFIKTFNTPVIMSTGMSNIEEVDTAVSILKDYVDLELMHCISAYPTPEEMHNMNMIDFYKERYSLKVGYSGHEIGWLPSICAVSKGADSIERHITLDSKMNGFDHKLSLEPKELTKMVLDIRSVEKILGNAIRNVNEIEDITRKKYHVSAVTKKDFKENQIIKMDDLIFKNPGTGLSYYEAKELIKNPLNINVSRDVLLTKKMFK